MNMKSILGNNQSGPLALPLVESGFSSIKNMLKFDNLISKIVHKTNLVQNKLIPGSTLGKIDSLLFAPRNKRRVTARAPRDFRSEKIQTRGGEVHAIVTGSGPTVVFVHGWGGASDQFLPLMRGLARCGFTALVFDHLGYGQSKAKPITLQQSITTTNDILQHVAKNANAGIAAVVGHSTGCISILNARPALIKDIPLFLISPVFNYKLFILKRLVKLKLPGDVIRQYADQFGKTYKKEYETLELGRHLTKHNDVAVIAHDESDVESAVGDSIKFCQQNPLTRLLITKKFDHSRVVNSESVWQELRSILNYDDTAVTLYNP
ncbi:MAG: alpha/beta hydrolase [Gammaproteobacteria bacterium]|nr:alpha/beta hydrolase [Gammaproteobacteria bacterium]